MPHVPFLSPFARFLSVFPRLFSYAHSVKLIPVIVFATVAGLFGFGSTVSVFGDTVTITYNISITFPYGVPAGGQPIQMEIPDFKTGTTSYQWHMSTGAETFTTTADYQCVDGVANTGFTVYYFDSSGNWHQSSGAGGGSICAYTGQYYNLPAQIDYPTVIDFQEAGPVGCSAGKPVNVMNGNMYIVQNDYRLPGVGGDAIQVTRTYNSIEPWNLSFGTGWITSFDEAIYSAGTGHLKLLTETGKVAYFTLSSTNHYVSTTAGSNGTIDVNSGDGTYIVNFKDGRKSKFSSSGTPVWRKDRNGNQTTFNYTSGVLTGLTDYFGRTISISRNGSGNISSISDSTGTIADYEYYSGTTLLKTVTYPDGSKSKFEYTTVGGTSLLSTVKDALDNVTEYHDYDSSKRATSSVVDGGVEEYAFDYTHTFDSSTPYTKVTDALGRVTKYYIERLYGMPVVTKVEGVCSCGGGGNEATEYTYDGRLNLVKKVDALSNETDYTYDADDNVTSITNSLGTEYFTYNSSGEVLTHTDRMGASITNTYNSAGGLLTATETLYQSITWTNKVGVAESPTGTITRNTGSNSWGGAGASSTESLSGNGKMQYVVGQVSYHRVIGIGYADSNQSYTDVDFAFALNADDHNAYLYENGSYTSVYTPISFGSVLEIERVGTTIYYKKDGAVVRTVTGVSTSALYVDTALYSNAGVFGDVKLINAGSVVDPKVTLTYTSLGQPETVTDARSKTTSLSYDSEGRLTEVTDANSNTTEFDYNDRAQVTSVTNALSQTTSFDYVDNNRLEKITYPDTHHVDIAYDLAGRRTSVTDELGHATTYAYDAAYRVTSITDALSHATTFDYDDMSNLTSQTDALGNVTSMEYDDFNRVKKIIYPAPIPSATPLQETITYDKLGNVASKTDTAGHTTSYDYDDASRLTKITDALSHETQFTYNARSQTTKVTDALNQEYNFTYDEHGRVLTQNRNGQTTTFTYDAVGNRATRTDYNGNVTSYTYDDLNRLTAIAYTGASGENASYTYDDLSRLLTATNAAGTVTFSYDNRGRLGSEEDVFGHVLEYTYDAAGRRIGLELDSTPHTSYAYDNANRLTTLTDEASHDFTYAYDNANRLTSKVMTNGITSTYTYDGMSRLKRLKHENSTNTLYDDQFTYNAANQISEIVGLSATKDFTYDNINRLTAETDSTTSESYTYDAVGNRTASHLSSSYTTGSFNRLTATDSASYSYNSNGSMTGKTVGSTTWTYGWDRENRMVSAGDGTSSVTYVYDALGRRVKRTQGSDVQKYTHDGADVVLDDVNSTLTKYQNGPGIDNKLKSLSGSTSKYFLQNHLGSSVGIANSSGSTTDSNGFDSFGIATNGSFPTRYQFTGREIDSLTGLQFSRARFYDPKIGRFISEDPIGLDGGINTFAYVRNNPLAFTDSLGLDAEWDRQLWQAQQDLLEALAPVIRGGIGFGDEATMGVSKIIRNLQGIDDPTLPCSWEYQAGGYVAFAIEIAAGGADGLRAAGAKGAGLEFSHWIPKRFGGPRSMLNGNYVSIAEHALSDPYRYRFMPRIWKAINPLPNAVIQQWNRIPKVLKGSAVGATAGAATMTSLRCECK